MSKGKKPGQGTFAVGYGKPPRSSQFHKGQSGNPNGRPRKQQMRDLGVSHDSETDAILRKELNRKIKVTDRDGMHNLTMLEVIQRSQTKSAIGGSPIAQRDILQATRDLEARDAARAEMAQAARSDDFIRMQRWRDHLQRLWSQAAKEGREPHEPWPHTEDVLLNEQNLSWRIRGPHSEAGISYFRHIEARRDRYLIMSELELRRPVHDGRRWCELYILMVESLDRQLPLRWQLSERGERLMLSLAMTGTPKLRRVLRDLEGDVAYWNKLAYPLGERVEFASEVAKVLRPYIRKAGYRTVRAFEQHLEQENGNPPTRMLELFQR